MRKPSSSCRAYLAVVAVVGMLFLLYYVYSLTRVKLLIAFVFAVGVGALEAVRFILPGGEAVSASSGLVLMITWVHGPEVAIAADACALLFLGIWRRARPLNVAFNIGQLTMCIALASAVYRACGGSSGVLRHELLSATASGIVFFVVNSMFIERALAYYRNTAFFPAWWKSFHQFGARFGLPLLFAVVLAAGYPYMGPAFVLVVIFLILGQYLLLRRYALNSQERAVTSLLELTAQRNSTRSGHSDRVLRYAVAIGDELGLNAHEARMLRYAALLHDVGIQWVPESGRGNALSLEERRLMEQHPVEGARLIGQLAPLVPVAKLVRHHHEWYNGAGYPDGLIDGDIPLGSRILAVADAFESMTSDQVHRRALRPEEAIAELNAMSGIQFDPDIVGALLRALDKDPTLLAVPHQRDSGDVNDEIALTIRHLKDYVTGAEEFVSHGRLLFTGDVSEKQPEFIRELRRRAAGIVALYDLGRVINSSLSLDDVLDLVARTAGKTANARCAVLLLDAEERELVFAASYGLLTHPKRLPRLVAAEGPWGQALSGRTPVSVDVFAEALPAEVVQLAKNEGVESLWLLPLVAKGSPIGLLCLLHGAQHRLAEQEQNLLAIVASQAALAIENAKLYSETRNRLEEISEMKQFTDAILDNANTGIMVVDCKGKIQRINREARAIVKTIEPDLGEESSWDDSRLVSKLRSGLQLDKVLKTGQATQVYGLEIRGVDGPVIIDAQASALTDQKGQNAGAIIVFRDVTEKSRLEEQVRQSQQLAMIGELAAGAAHEIRNPLTAIRGFIQVLEDRSNPTGNLEEYFDILLAEIDRIDELLTGMLQLSRRPANKVPTNLHQLMDDQWLLLRSDRNFVNYEFVRNYADDLPLVQADRNQLLQVMLNLYTNAVQSMPDGGWITVTTLHHEAERRVEVRIADTGEGIKPEHRSRIFTPFFTTKGRGTGLGLALSYGIIRNHGGQLSFESEPGQGAEFRFWLPIGTGDVGEDDEGT